jgi:putative NADH-flavin reductase
VRITVFGATGRTGSLVVRGATERGHEVAALVRDRSRLTGDESFRVVHGDARDLVSVQEAVRDADAVVSVLAIVAGTEPTTEISDVTRTIVDAMSRARIDRLVLTTNSTVFHERDVAEPYRVVAEEHRRNLATLSASDRAWTVIAPGFLTDDPGTGEYQATVGAAAPERSISRADLALVVLDALERDDWIGHAVGVSSP